MRDPSPLAMFAPVRAICLHVLGPRSHTPNDEPCPRPSPRLVLNTESPSHRATESPTPTLAHPPTPETMSRVASTLAASLPTDGPTRVLMAAYLARHLAYVVGLDAVEENPVLRALAAAYAAVRAARDPTAPRAWTSSRNGSGATRNGPRTPTARARASRASFPSPCAWPRARP